MVEYTNTEYTDVVLVYGEAAGIGRHARRIYEECYPPRVTPSHILFAKDSQRLRERGIFTVNRADCSAPRRRRILNFEEDVLHWVEETPSTRTRTNARGMSVHEQQLHPYHPQRIHAIDPADFALRVTV